jgi:serine phosphatase RsbU (regulator of sigma subunit)/Tfp pilus assembly protein PilF
MPRRFFLILSALTAFVFSAAAQDSLLKIARKNPPDTSSVSAYVNLAQSTANVNYDSSVAYAQKGLTIAARLNDNYWKGRCYYQMGLAGYYFGHSKEAVDHFSNAVFFLEKDSAKTYWVAKSLNGMGNAQRPLGREKEATDNYLEAQKIFEKLHDKKGLAGVYNNLGIVFMEEGQQEKALEYYRIARRMNIEISNKPWLGKNLSNMGNAFFNLRNYDSAEYYFRESQKISLAINDSSDWALDVMNLGNVYTSKKDFKKAQAQFDAALKFDRDDGRESDMANVMHNLAGLYIETGDFASAKLYLDSSFAIATKYNDLAMLVQIYETYAVFYDKTGDYKNAFIYYGLYATKKDSINTTDMKSQMDQMEESLREAGLKEKNEKLEEEKLRSNIISYAAVGGIVLVLALGFVLFKRYQLKKRANLQLTAHNKMIESQKAIIEQKNLDISDSINYAKRIQETLLPDLSSFHAAFPDSFIFFRPRDIVSGDFYWFASKDGKRLVAAVDCTGHGIPGAFMSMIGNAFLQEIVNGKGITKPADILSELRFLVINALKQKGQAGEQHDGMDISLCCFDENNKSVEWAGANNPLWILRNNECIEVEPDKRPIGFFRGQGMPFTNHRVELQKNDILFLFTDGYTDQFGGPKQKKMMKKNFKKILLAAANEPGEIQKKILAEKFDAWKGKLDQVDDVCVIGIRVG